MKGPLFIKTWVFFTKNALCKFGLNWPSSYINLNKPESMLCTNFSWKWPSVSGGVFQMLSMYFCYFVIISPWALHLRHPRFSRFLNVVNVVYFTITIFSSLVKGVVTITLFLSLGKGSDPPFSQIWVRCLVPN